VAVTCGPADEDAVGALRSALPSTVPIRLLTGLELRQLASILASADLVVGNDSGITHLATLVGAPTVAIFGPFDPAYWAPIGPRVEVVDAGESCVHRDDPREGCRRCLGIAFMPIELIWQAIESLLQ
jgi:ADP-heptose:LPS heptosyltransferase